MGPMAELATIETEQINFELWEHELGIGAEGIASTIVPEVVESFRPAESEIYGRSLRTIHRLGAFMVDKSLPEIIVSPEAKQAKIEFFTSVQEGFGTDLELGGGLEVRDFDHRPLIDGRIMAKDLKTPVSAMTEAGLDCAVETAKKDDRFLPQLTRSEWDHENALLVDSMARKETTYNTRIVISPFPEEAAAKSGDDYWREIGYVPHLRRGFVQLYHATEDGIVSGSLSFDGSDKKRLKGVFSKYDVEIPETEVTDNWLQYAITDTLSEGQAKELALEIADLAADPKYEKTTNTVNVTDKYGTVMDNVFNESYVHVCESLYRGHQTPGAKGLISQLANNAHNFNDRYAAALHRMKTHEDKFTDDDSVVLHELLVYSTIEMMRALHLKTKPVEVSGNEVVIESVQPDFAYLQSLTAAQFQGVLGGYGAEGARNNRTYSACGLSISAGGNSKKDAPGTLNDKPQNVYGGVDEAVEAEEKELSDDKYGSRYFKCPKGHLNTRWKRDELIKRCQVCNCDVTC